MRSSAVSFHPVILKVMRCSKIASVKVSEITELISKALENDKKARWETASHINARFVMLWSEEIKTLTWNSPGKQVVGVGLLSLCLSSESPLWKWTRLRWRCQMWRNEPLRLSKKHRLHLGRILNLRIKIKCINVWVFSVLCRTVSAAP